MSDPLVETPAGGTSAPSAPPRTAHSGLILILSASAGAGHMVAAQALAAAFEHRAPRCTVEVVDVLQLTNGFFRRLYAQGYLALVNHAPSAMGWLYEAMDQPAHRFRDRLRVGFQNMNVSRVEDFLTQRQPALIVNTHFLSAEIVAQMRRAERLDCPQVTVTTDFETHRLWVQSPTERYYTATDEGKAYLAEWGVPRECVHVTGIPVRPGFQETLAQAEARQRCQLDPDRRMILMLCGGFGVGPTQELFANLLRVPEPAQLVVIAGRNEALRVELESIARHAGRAVTVLGFTEQMHLYMRAADLVVTKPGGLTVSEALVCGLPLVVVNPIPGQEARNSDFLLERGAAIKVNNPRLLSYRVQSVLENDVWLQSLQTAARQLGRPDAADAIAADALATQRTTTAV